jgi:hypothetical protein
VGRRSQTFQPRAAVKSVVAAPCKLARSVLVKVLGENLVRRLNAMVATAAAMVAAVTLVLGTLLAGMCTFFVMSNRVDSTTMRIVRRSEA